MEDLANFARLVEAIRPLRDDPRFQDNSAYGFAAVVWRVQ